MKHFAILLLVTICDALRDRWIYRRPDVGWLRWHVVKWVSFYVPAVLIWLDADFSAYDGFCVVLVCWAFWYACYWYGRIDVCLEERAVAQRGNISYRLEITLRDRM